MKVGPFYVVELALMAVAFTGALYCWWKAKRVQHELAEERRKDALKRAAYIQELVDEALEHQANAKRSANTAKGKDDEQSTKR